MTDMTMREAFDAYDEATSMVRILMEKRSHNMANRAIFLPAFEVLVTEKTRLANLILAGSSGDYHAIAQNLKDGKDALDKTKQRAEQFADELSLAASAIESLGKIVSAIKT